MNFTPSLFQEKPWGSTLQNCESEIIAMNIMVILKRTGDTFRELTWDEYKTERLQDKAVFSEKEKPYFEKVSYLSLGNRPMVINFSPVWKDIYIKELEKEQTA
jgi:hypothetical protein